MTLDDGTTTITLPDALEWVNEFDFSYVTQDARRTIGGSLILSESTLTKGRPINLVGGATVWVNRSEIEALFNWANTADKEMTLTLADARTFTVLFNRVGNSPIVAKPVWRKNVQEATDTYTLELNLLEV